MIASEKVIEHLDEMRAKLTKLAGEEIAGFALVIPPDGTAITIISMESHPDERSFYKSLADRLVGSKESQQLGGVGMPRGIR